MVRVSQASGPSLTALLQSTPYLLVYSLPLLAVSSLLTFAGAFLTLDRTRSFPPSVDAGSLLSNGKRIWLLEGGAGGLSIGYVFGLHLSTFLSLLIPAVASVPALSPPSFLAVWILSVIPTSFLCGRWKYSALAAAGISGGSLSALALSTIIQLSLTSLIILTVIVVITLTVVVLLPLPDVQHLSLRFATSVTGSFGLTLSIALLAHTPGWANVWDRFCWLDGSVKWGTAKERGLTTAFCLLLCTGMLCDWALKWKFGECPDQRWDHYLAKYASNHPKRAGTFRPLRSFWAHKFASPSATEPDHDTKADHELPLLPQSLSIRLRLHESRVQRQRHGLGLGTYDNQSPQTVLKNDRRRSHVRFQARVGKRRDLVKFKPSSHAQIEPSSGEKSFGQPPTLATVKQPSVASPFRSNEELAVGSASSTTAAEADDPAVGTVLVGFEISEEGKVPGHTNHESNTVDHPRETELPPLEPRSDRWFYSKSPSSAKLPQLVLGAVPATPPPSNALARIAVAQRPGVRPLNKSTVSPTSFPPSEASNLFAQNTPLGCHNEDAGNGGLKWDDFWKEVRSNANVPST